MAAKVDQHRMREVNRQLVVERLQRAGTASRAQLAAATGLTKPTVSAIVEELVGEGVIRELGLGPAATNGGRRPQLLEFNPSSAAYLGIHFGAGHTRVAVADGQGAVLAMRARRSVRGDSSRSMRDARDLVSAVLGAAGVPRRRLRAGGVTVAGVVDRSTGDCVLSANLRWNDVPLRADLSSSLGLPVVTLNVLHATALAESRIGLGAGVGSFVSLYVGEGVGAGIVLDGRVYYGPGGASGEIGHGAVVENGEVCTCGRRGCLETVAGGPAIARLASEAVARGEATKLSNRRRITARSVAQAAAGGDTVAKRILVSAGTYLGRSLATLLNALAVDFVIVDGRMAGAGDALLAPLIAETKVAALAGERVVVVASKLGEHAEVSGAVLAAMESVGTAYRLVGGDEELAEA